MKKEINTAIIITTLIFCGCRSNQDPVKYAEDKSSGLKKEITIGEVHYSVQYKPASYIVEKEHLDTAASRERMNQLKGVLWFNVSFSINGFDQSPLRYKVSGIDEYNARQNYYLNQAPRDMYLLYCNYTLYVEGYWFENNQNLSPFETMVIGFKLPKNDSVPRYDLRFSFYDRVFKNGIIKSIISKDDINRSEAKIL
jgi:hypothetical protein